TIFSRDWSSDVCSSDLSCEYALNQGNPTKEQSVVFTTVKNAIQTTGLSRCVLPELDADETSNNLDVSDSTINNLLTAYIEPAIDNRFLGMYYPRDNGTATDLVDVGVSGCADQNQYVIDRVVVYTLTLNPDVKN